MKLEAKTNIHEKHQTQESFFFFFFNLFIFGYAGSSLLQAGFLQLQQVGATLVVAQGLLVAVSSLVAERRL